MIYIGMNALDAEDGTAESYDTRVSIVHDIMDTLAESHELATCCVAAQLIVDLMGVVAVYEGRTPPTDTSQEDVRAEAERRTGKSAARMARARAAH